MSGEAMRGGMEGRSEEGNTKLTRNGEKEKADNKR